MVATVGKPLFLLRAIVRSTHLTEIRKMTTYCMEVVGDTLKVDFAKNEEGKQIAADGSRIVRDVQLLAGELIAAGKLAGGNLLKIDGRISVAASYTLAHEVAHLYRAIAVADTRVQAYVVVSSTAPEYPVGSRVDSRTGEVTQVNNSTELSPPSFLMHREGNILRVEINPAVQVDGDQIFRDAKLQLQKLINSGELSGGKLLKINGRSTVLASFAIAFELAHLYDAIAVFEPKLGDRGLDRYIVSISHTSDYQVGETLDVECDRYQSAKVVLCGCPNTGKTVFRDGLRQVIYQHKQAPKDFYVISGCPDGDGCWYSETAQKYPELAAQLKQEYKAKFTPEFAAVKAKDIAAIKNSLLLFDVGGKISPENELIMSKATHAVILAKSESEVTEWQDFCQKLNLPVIAVIYSSLAATADWIHSESPQLTGIVHKLERGEPVATRPMIHALAKRLIQLAKPH